MSGVVLVVSFGGRPIGEDELDPLVAAGAHRGPHGVRIRLQKSAGAAFLELDATGHVARQPLESDDADYLMVADCRLDNRTTLSRCLGAAEERSDAELVLGAYRRWGAACPGRLLGDFALAIWDGVDNRVVLARDALGVRTLHFARLGDLLIVASEAQQVARFPGFPRDFDERKLGDCLTGGLEDDGRTFYRHVSAVRPGEAVLVRRHDTRAVRYWDPAAAAPVRYRRQAEYVDHFRSLFMSSVKARLRTAAKSVGVQLSGGLDSGSIAACGQALAGRSGGPALLGLSAVFGRDSGCDERPFIHAVAAKSGLETACFTGEDYALIDRDEDGAARVDPESPLHGWPALDRAMGETLRDRGSRVLLTGHGGDSIAYGSPLVYADLARKARFMALATDLAGHAWQRRRSPVRLAYLYLARPLLPEGVLEQLRLLKHGRSAESLPPWIGRRFAARCGLLESRRVRAAESRPGDTARDSIVHGVRHLGDVAATIHWLERAMAPHGVEVRHPFLDRTLAEFVVAVPPRCLYRAGVGKRLLRDAMRELLPESIRARKSKAVFLGFAEAWLRRDSSGFIEELETGHLVGMGVLEGHALRSALEEWRAGSGKLTGTLMRLIGCEIWARRAVRCP